MQKYYFFRIYKDVKRKEAVSCIDETTSFLNGFNFKKLSYKTK